MEESSFMERVVGAASNGAAGAFIAAALSSAAEPVVNRVLVKRMALREALAEVDFDTVSKFFETTLATNFIKFPFFEVVNMIVGNLKIPASTRGPVLGAVFTTVTLPITNYRYCKSMGLPVELSALYKAYLPTMIRDIIYGVFRNEVSGALLRAYPELGKTAKGRFVLMFVAVLAACVASAPGNEVRGYYLQPKEKRLPVKEFFQRDRFIRSTSIGGLIMSTSLALGSLASAPATEQANKLRKFLADNPMAKVLLVLFLIQQVNSSRHHQSLLLKMDSLQANRAN